MIHFEDKILELFVLGVSDISVDRNEIEAHLGVCSSCRKRRDEIASFYAELRSELREAETTAGQPEMLPARTNAAKIPA